MNREVLKVGKNRRIRIFILSVAAIGLLLSLGNAPAQEFKNSNFKGRYICRSASDRARENAVTGIEPDGKGGFKGGIKGLVSHDFKSTDAACSVKPLSASEPCPCVYTLDLTSSYAIAADGTGTATMKWVPALGNNAVCPDATFFAGLTDQWHFILTRSATTAQVASNNNGFEEESGLGSCSRGSVQ